MAITKSMADSRTHAAIARSGHECRPSSLLQAGTKLPSQPEQRQQHQRQPKAPNDFAHQLRSWNH